MYMYLDTKSFSQFKKKEKIKSSRKFLRRAIGARNTLVRVIPVTLSDTQLSRFEHCITRMLNFRPIRNYFFSIFRLLFVSLTCISSNFVRKRGIN